MDKKITAEDVEKGILKFNEEQMEDMFEEFLKDVEDNDYAVVPNVSKFADYIGFKRSEVQRWMKQHKYSADKMKELASDTIASGAMLKKYYANTATLVLKNWCGWEEAPKKTLTSKEEQREKSATEMLNEYIKQERKGDNEITFRRRAL